MEFNREELLVLKEALLDSLENQHNEAEIEYLGVSDAQVQRLLDRLNRTRALLAQVTAALETS